jgi:serralysin
MNRLRFLFPLLALPFTAPAQEELRICTEMPAPDAEEIETADIPYGMVARAVAYKPELGKYWENGRNLKVRFLGGTPYVRNKVMGYAREWSKVANIQFTFVEKGNADVRISFVENQGSWSAIGTDARRIPQNRATMNFGWLNARTSEVDFRSTVLHEFGHVLGLLHEHQHPTGGVPWDKPRLYQYYQKSQGWNREVVDQQVLTKLNRDRTQYTRYDPYSIMHYPIPNSLTVGDFEIRMNSDLSATDRAFVGKLYPGRSSAETTTSTTRPTRTNPTRTSPPPSRQRLVSATIRDFLPDGQKQEQVWITINGITKTFAVKQPDRRTNQVEFDVPAGGRYDYEVTTKTVFYQRVNGRLQEKILYGHGEGTLSMPRDGCFDLVIGKALNEKWFEVHLTPCQ